MKQTFKLFGALALCLPFALCGCTTKGGEANEKVTKVKILEVNNSLGDGVQTYSGTIEESDGTSLSFAGGGTVTRVAVNAGQSVKRGQLIATVDSRNAANSASASRASIEQAAVDE